MIKKLIHRLIHGSEPEDEVLYRSHTCPDSTVTAQRVDENGLVGPCPNPHHQQRPHRLPRPVIKRAH